MGKKKNKNSDIGHEEVELNVMPFIDIFSLLCTFLLFSAVFVSIGILEVQVPFLTSAAPSSKNENKRELSIKIDLDKKNIELTSSFNLPPINKKTENFNNSGPGIRKLHNRLLDLKETSKEDDKVTLFVDDNIKYETLVEVLDQIKLRFPGDRGYKEGEGKSLQAFLFSKVVMGNVIL